MRNTISIAVVIILGLANLVASETYLGWVDYEDYCSSANCETQGKPQFKVGFELNFVDEEFEIIYIILDSANDDNVNFGDVDFPQYFNEKETAHLFPDFINFQIILGTWEDANGSGDIFLLSEDNWQNLEVIMDFENGNTNHFSLGLDETAPCCDLKKWIRGLGTFDL